MSHRMFSVRVILTDECPDSIEEIIHGNLSSLGPTFDKIQEVAIKNNGSFEDWEPVCCDYSFPSRQDANKFIKNIKSTFKGHILIERVNNKDLEMDDLDMRVFKTLPLKLPERIAALTPKTIFSSFDIKISILHDDDCFVENKVGNKFTYINMRCKITGKIRSKMFYLQSGLKAIEKFVVEMKESNPEIKNALEAGWSVSDISYDAFINGVLYAEMDKINQDESFYHEVFLSCNTIQIVIYDYFGSQYIGWFFYNENLDEALIYTNYNLA